MLGRVRTFIAERRVVLSRTVLVLAVLSIGLHLHRASPQETDVAFELGVDHAQVAELQVAYVQSDEAVRVVHFRYPNGAPQEVKHRLSLSAGTYEVRFSLRLHDGSTRQVSRSLTTPTEGRTRLVL